MSGAKLPPGQKTHVLHHTLASHSMMSGGNILTLQRVLGHALLNLTMRYAHLAPDHLLDVLTLGPGPRSGTFVTCSIPGRITSASMFWQILPFQRDWSHEHDEHFPAGYAQELCR